MMKSRKSFSDSGWVVRFDHKISTVDFPRLDKTILLRVKDAIDTKLLTNPEIFGSPLRGSLKGFWKLRVNEWRIIYSLENKLVYIWAVGHRSQVYEIIYKRIFG